MTEKVKQVSRREFIKLSSAGFLSAALSELHQSPVSARGLQIGRVLLDVILMYDRPSFNGVVVKSLKFDELITIDETVIGDEFPAYNRAWHRIGEIGYIHSSQVQPVKVKYNEPQKPPDYGILSEVTVPFTHAREGPGMNFSTVYRYYHGSTHWVNRLVKGEDGIFWYRIDDDQGEEIYYYVRAEHLHVIPFEEVSPLSPDVPNWEKTVSVFMDQQMMIAYEGNDAVYIAQISTGDTITNHRWKTPLGRFETFYKRPSRHMAAGNMAFGEYDLPGVPWVNYLTSYGIAFHGTYWHNEFGTPRSHGCINMTPEDAKWLYRWTRPDVPYDYQLKYRPGHGTQTLIL